MRSRTIPRATAAVEPVAQRDAVETAHNDFLAISDRVSFYVGLAFGVTAWALLLSASRCYSSSCTSWVPAYEINKGTLVNSAGLAFSDITACA